MQRDFVIRGEQFSQGKGMLLAIRPAIMRALLTLGRRNYTWLFYEPDLEWK
jgi:hypothetical protein